MIETTTNVPKTACREMVGIDRQTSTDNALPCPFGKYLLLRKIGAGGMAEVFKARMSGTCGFEEESAEYTAEDASDEDMYLHTVQWPGETLALIAEWYTGDSKNWTVLSDFNAGYGSDAVQPSQVILIPKFLLITTTPMPRSFVAPLPPQEGPRLPPPRKTVQRPRSRPKPRLKKEPSQGSKPEPAAKPAPEPETLELFGPKE
jgi:hypothetical protein